MDKAVLDYGFRPPRKKGWLFQAASLLLGMATVPVTLAAAWACHELRFSYLTDQPHLRGKTVSQIIGVLGPPDEDHRDTDEAIIIAATQPLIDTYGPNEHFNGSFVYLDWLGNRFCRIEIRNGAATQVVHGKDVK